MSGGPLCGWRYTTPKYVPLDVAFCVEGVPRRFLSLFAGRDNSFYVRPYRPDGEPWITPELSREDETTLKLDFTRATTHSFEPNKVSFHPSGYVHVTDRQGRRFRDGNRHVRFEDAELPHALGTFVPCDPRRLPLAPSSKSARAEFVLPPEMPPFHLQISLVTQAIAAETKSSDAVDVFFRGMPYGVRLSLRAIVRGRPTERIEWPAAPFFLLRTAA